MAHNIVIERDVMVPMRDGVRLASEGTWQPYVYEGRDAYDTVEWAAAQPWSDGNVGLYGSCALGFTTIQGAVEAPPHLKAIFAYMTAINHYNGWTYSTGALELGFGLSWTWIMAQDTLSRLNLEPAALEEAQRKLAEASNDIRRSACYLPLIDFPAHQNGAAPYWRDWLSHPSYDEFWRGADAVARADRIKVPVLHASGWYDLCLRGHLDLNRALQSRGDERVRDEHRLILWPTDHSAYYNKRPTYAGERDFGPSAMTGPDTLAGIAFEWFDRWLRGGGTEPVAVPKDKVRYFQMGENVWKEASSWPPPHTPAVYYLHSAGRANTRMGDGALDTEPLSAEPTDSYVYDPLDPVPSAGGRSMIGLPTGVENQAHVEEREDVLVYTTPRLAEPLSIAGPVSLTLHASSSAPDTDFTAKLVDVEPDGYCANIAGGITRARYRNGCDKEEFLEPGRVTKFVIDLWDVAHTFKSNHRIRLEISSSNFPEYDRNLNSRVSPGLGRAEDAQKAVQQIFHDDEHPSYIALPVVS
jgi:putative CocE/NonD family hydrolase